MSTKLPHNFDGFYNVVLGMSLNSLKFNNFSDNFDAERFNFDGQDRSRDFDLNARMFFFSWFFARREKLFEAYSSLSSEQSKLLYICLIVYRLAGHLAFKIPVDFLSRQKELEAFRNAEKFTESQYPVTGMFGKLQHFDFEFEGHRYVADCLGLEACLHRRQYFYEVGDVRVMPEPGDVVIDGGACTGDTALVFSNAVGPAGKVYSFDPVKDHIDILRYNIAQFPYQNVVAMPYGLSDHEADAPLIVTDHYAPGFSVEATPVPLTSLDSLVERGQIDRIDYIKLDVEGAELETLKGAAQSIRKFRPKMAISLYHKPDDIFSLLLYVKEHFDFYKFYIGHYTIHQEETVLYCAPVSR